MPGSTASEVTLQLLMQNSHKWVYKGPIRAQPRPTSTALLLQHEAAAGLEGLTEDGISGAAKMLEQADSVLDEILDEEYDEEEVQCRPPSPAIVFNAGRTHPLYDKMEGRSQNYTVTCHNFGVTFASATLQMP